MKYLLLSSCDSQKLSQMINKHLEKGWKLYGSPSISTRDNFNGFCQAIIYEGNGVKNKIKYLLVSSNDRERLSEMVNKYLTENWRLYGSPDMNMKVYYTGFCQAIIYEE